MYSALGWLDGLAIDTGGVKVLIADTIVWNMETEVLKHAECGQYSENTTARDKTIVIYKNDLPQWRPSHFSWYPIFFASFLWTEEEENRKEQLSLKNERHLKIRSVKIILHNFTNVTIA